MYSTLFTFISTVIVYIYFPAVVNCEQREDFLQKPLDSLWEKHGEGECTQVLITTRKIIEGIGRAEWEANYLQKGKFAPRVILCDDPPILIVASMFRAAADYIPYLWISSERAKRFSPSCTLNLIVKQDVFEVYGLSTGLVTFSRSTWYLRTVENYFIFLTDKENEAEHLKFLQGTFGRKIKRKISFRVKKLQGDKREVKGETILETFFYKEAIKNLNGRQLQGAIIPPPPGLLESHGEKENRTGRGVYYQYILSLQERFNCSIEYTRAQYGTGAYSKVNGTFRWIGAVGDMLERNYDLAIISAMTLERLQVIDISCPIQDQYFGFRVRIPAYSISWLAAIKPLEKIVWVLTICLMISFIMLFLVDRSIGGRTKLISIFEIGWDVFKLMVSQGVDYLPRMSYFILGQAFIFSLLMSTCYNSKLVSFLTFPQVYYPQTFAELNELSNYKIYAVNYKSTGEKVMNRTYPNLKNRVQYVQPMDCIERMLDDQYSVCIDYENCQKYWLEKYFTLSSAHDESSVIYSFTRTPIVIKAGVTFPKDLIYSREIIVYTDHLSESGLLNFWVLRDFRGERAVGIKMLKAGDTEVARRIKPKVEHLYEVAEPTLKLHHIMGVLAGWIIFLIISIFLFVLEYFVHLKRRFCLNSPITETL